MEYEYTHDPKQLGSTPDKRDLFMEILYNKLETFPKHLQEEIKNEVIKTVRDKYQSYYPF